MSDVTITIVGTGVIGTSLGLALKQLEDPPKLIGHDKEHEHARQAFKMGAFDKTEWNLISACEQADLIILAIPAAGVKATLEAIASDLKEDVLVSDTVPSKSKIIQMAEDILPNHAHFVGGNPIVTTENTGPEYAHADLFQQSLYCLTPTPSVVPEAVKLLEDVVKLVGATPFFLDPLEHDGLMSGVQGLPALLSIALVNGVSQPASWLEMRKLAGGLFSKVSAGAIGDPDSLTEEFLNNKDNLLRWLGASVEALQAIKRLIETDQEEELAQLIDKAVVTRANWQKDFEEKVLSNLVSPPSEELKKPGFLKQLFGLGR
jgi:prephenate dehydrogenase